MDEIMYTNLLKNIALLSAVLGVLLGLDMLLGAPVIGFLKRILDKHFNFDKIITNPKVSKTLGTILIILSLIILLLIRRV